MNKKTERYLTFTLMIAVISFVVPANADLSFYTDRSAWEAAVTGEITEDFDSVAPYELVPGINNAGLIDIEMRNLSDIDQWNSINDGSSFLNINGTPFYQGGCRLTDPDTIINLHLPSPPVWAFGADFTSTHSSATGNGLTMEVNGLEYDFRDLIPSGEGTGFLGFISTDAFSTVTLFDTSNNETFGLDNVSFAVPEPSAMMLLGIGATCLLGKTKK